MALSMGKLFVGQQTRFQSFFRSCYVAQSRCFITQDKPRFQAPKKPGNGYSRFLTDQFKHVKTANPNLKTPEVMKEIGVKWRALPEAKKQEYTDRAAVLMAKYMKEKETYLKSLSDQELSDLKTEQETKRKKRTLRKKKQLSKKLEKPKGRTTSFMEYMKEMAPTRENIPITEFSKSVGRIWRQMSDDGKQRFIVMAEQKNKIYEATLRQWEDKMIKEGHPELVRKAHQPKPPRRGRRKSPKKKASAKKKTAAKKKKTTKAKRGGKSAAKKTTTKAKSAAAKK